MKKTFSTRPKRDWKNYNNQLKQRASLQIWLRKEVIDERKDRTGDEGRETGKRKRGHPFWTAKLPLSFWLNKPNLSPSFSLAYLPLPVPCFSTLCRRRRKLKFEVFRVRKGKGGGKVLIVDSSGVKVMGEGEWAKMQRGKGNDKEKGGARE